MVSVGISRTRTRGVLQVVAVQLIESRAMMSQPMETIGCVGIQATPMDIDVEPRSLIQIRIGRKLFIMLTDYPSVCCQ
jgi:hypothetical protein